MANIKIYSIDSSGGPTFEKPYTSGKPYSEDTNHKAIGIAGASAIVDNVLENIGSLTNDIAALKDKINTLSDYWNNCIELESKKSEYVPIEDLITSIEDLDETCTTGKENCDSILAEYNAIIEDINTYLDLLEINYKEYSSLSTQLVYTLIQKTNNEEEKQTKDSEIIRLNNALQDYKKIDNITSYGKWVE